MADDRYVFIVEWFDSAASLVRNYNLTYYTKDGSIDMYDLKNKRVFLKKCEYPSIQLKDIFIGSILTIYSRQLKVADFADDFTRNRFEKQRGKTFAMIKPDAYLDMGRIINAIQEEGFTLGNIKMARMTQQDAEHFYAQHKGRPFWKDLISHMSSDLLIGLELIADNSISKWRNMLGPPKDAKIQSPNSIRARYGTQGVKNAAHGSDSSSAANKELEFFFNNKNSFSTPACFSNCSCLVIKPHVITDGYVGQVIDAVLSSGFQISAMQMFWLDRPSAQEFLEVYKNVVPEYNQLIEELTSGACIAMEVRQDNVVTTLRQLCGPHDPEMAKSVRPKSLRAIYGKDKAKNAVHCTDLIEDGALEVEYFFNILQK